MIKLLSRVALGLFALCALVIGLAWWARPDLRAAMTRLPRSIQVWTRASNEAPQPVAVEGEVPVELIDDGWCSTHHVPEAKCDRCPETAAGEGRPCLQELPLIRLSGPDVAARIGTVREIVSRLLARLTREGVLQIEGRTVTILRSGALEP